MTDQPAAPTPRRIDQTEFGPKGNCQSACLAMLLGCDLAEVPNFAAMEGDDNLKYAAQAEWLSRRGWALLTIAKWQTLPWPPTRGFYIAGGVSERGNQHAVVYHNGQPFHDPHPDRTGIKAVEEIDFLYPLNPLELAAAESRLREAIDLINDMACPYAMPDNTDGDVKYCQEHKQCGCVIGVKLAAIDAAREGEKP